MQINTDMIKSDKLSVKTSKRSCEKDVKNRTYPFLECCLSSCWEDTACCSSSKGLLSAAEPRSRSSGRFLHCYWAHFGHFPCGSCCFCSMRPVWRPWPLVSGVLTRLWDVSPRLWELAAPARAAPRPDSSVYQTSPRCFGRPLLTDTHSPLQPTCCRIPLQHGFICQCP